MLSRPQTSQILALTQRKGRLLRIRAAVGDVFRNRNILLVVITWSLFSLIESMFLLYAPDYMRKLGGTPRTIGILNSLVALVSMLVMIPGGYFADKRGRKSLIVWGTFLAAFPTLLQGIAGNWRVYFVATVVGSAFSNFYLPAINALFQDSLSESTRAFTLGVVESMIHIPSIVGSFAGGYLYNKYGLTALRCTLVANSAVYLISAGLRMGLRETLEIEVEGRASLGEALSSLISSFRGVSESISWLKGPLARLMVMNVLFGVHWGLTGGFWFIYALDIIGIDSFQFGLLEASWTFLYLILAPAVGMISDRKGRIVVMRTAPIMISAFHFAFILCRGFEQALLLWIAWAIPDALWWASWEALWVDLVEGERRARVSMLRLVLSGLAQTASAAFSGYLYDVNPALPFFGGLIAWILVFTTFEDLRRLIS